jgi:lysozyme family protein
MPQTVARKIYRERYWNAMRCDELPAGIDYAVFDYGVNSGIGRSGKVLRRCLNLADNTTVVSDAVIAAAVKADAKALVTAICDERLRFLQSLKTWDVFGKGWGRRVAKEPLPDSASSAGKGIVPVAKGAQQGSAGAIVAAGAAAANQAHSSSAGAAAVTVLVAVALIGAIGAYAFWHWRQQRQQDAAA